MKPILLSSKSSHQDLLTYGKDLFDKLKTEYGAVAYDSFQPDFSDVPELFNDEEKVVMFNHFAIPDGFAAFSKYLPTFKKVKYILSPYSAYLGLDLELVKSLDIRFRNNGGANAMSVAQYAVMSMYMLLSKYIVFTRTMTMPDGSILGEELAGKTAGIIGMGNVGKEILKTLKGLGVPTVFYNRSAKEVGATQVRYEEIFNQDIVFVSVATNDESKALLADFASHLLPQQYVIDVTSTDSLYDKQSVIDLLDADKIRGYALELQAADFWPKSDKNLSATPHIAWCTIDAERKTVQNFLNRGLAILEGKADTVDFIV